MRRHLFTILSALSLLLFVAVAVLWVRSWIVGDTVGWTRASEDGSSLIDSWVVSGRGRLACGSYEIRGGGRHQVESDPVRWEVVGTGDVAWAWEDAPWHGWGFAGGREQAVIVPTMTKHTVSVTVPYWALAAAASMLPTVWLIARIRRRRTEQLLLCPSCGYGLRATPGRCPECGAVPVPAGDGVGRMDHQRAALCGRTLAPPADWSLARRKGGR